MISEEQYLTEVSKTKANISIFIEEAGSVRIFRNIVVEQLLNNEKINVYYHSYIILNKAIKNNPGKFFEYWDNFASLLHHSNSYHRNYAMELISQLISEDQNNKFELIFNDFYKQLYHEKISTRKYCISYSANIIKQKPEMADRIISEIIKSLRLNSNTEKHQNFLLLEFIKILTSIKHIPIQNSYVTEFLKDAKEGTGSGKIRKAIDCYITIQGY